MKLLESHISLRQTYEYIFLDFCGTSNKINYTEGFKVKMYLFLLVPYINYQGQKLTKSKKYISNNDFSTGFWEGTSHHSNSIITVAGINCNKMIMYKSITELLLFFHLNLQTLHCYLQTELNVKLVFRRCVYDWWYHSVGYERDDTI